PVLTCWVEQRRPWKARFGFVFMPLFSLLSPVQMNCSGSAHEQFYLPARPSQLNRRRMLAIDPLYRQTFAALELSSFGSVVSFFGGNKLSPQTAVLVKPETLVLPGGASFPVFYKQYAH